MSQIIRYEWIQKEMKMKRLTFFGRYSYDDVMILVVSFFS